MGKFSGQLRRLGLGYAELESRGKRVPRCPRRSRVRSDLANVEYGERKMTPEIRATNVPNRTEADAPRRGQPGPAGRAGRAFVAITLCSAVLVACGSVHADPAGGGD